MGSLFVFLDQRREEDYDEDLEETLVYEVCRFVFGHQLDFCFVERFEPTAAQLGCPR